MRQKHLESALSQVDRSFPDPQIELEQYPTSPTLTASVILTAQQNNDVGSGRTVLDLGCGTGMLGLGAALVESDLVIGIDCDPRALQIARRNAVDLELDDSMEFILGRIQSLTCSDGDKQGNRGSRGGGGRGKKRPNFSRGKNQQQQQSRRCTLENRQLILSDDDGLALRSKCVDTVLTNPPFGTKNNAGMDLRFLRTATRLARRAVYSFHKTSTRDFLVRHVQGVWGMSIQILAEMKFDLPQVYRFHKEKSVDVNVDLIRVVVSQSIPPSPRSDSIGHEEEEQENDNFE